MLNEIFLFLLIVVGFYDLFLVTADLPTISQRYQRLFSTGIDCILLSVVILGLVWLPIWMWMKMLLCAIAGHIFWPNKETHR
jgi:hypothetical protein